MESLLGGIGGGCFRSIDIELQDNFQEQDQSRTRCLNNKCKAVAMEHLKAFGLAVYFSFIFFAMGGSLRSHCIHHDKKYRDEEARLDDCKTANNLFIAGTVFFAVVYLGYMVDICNRAFPDEGGD